MQHLGGISDRTKLHEHSSLLVQLLVEGDQADLGSSDQVIRPIALQHEVVPSSSEN